MLYIHFVLQEKKISFEAKQPVVDFLKKILGVLIKRSK